MTGEEIRQMRVAMGWSQRQLGEHLGIEQATVSRLENGEWEPSRPVRRLLELLRASSSSTSPEAA
jgi:transcriptional regulator with XRE-family HTH domain